MKSEFVQKLKFTAERSGSACQLPGPTFDRFKPLPRVSHRVKMRQTRPLKREKADLARE